MVNVQMHKYARQPYIVTLNVESPCDERSPYLLQHNNPVDWYPWGDDAFAKARTEQKPIFLSIGYSTCHWCHVMEHESFEDASIADVLNRKFVAVKVDREERPDVDRVYDLCAGDHRRRRLPMSVWLTPELRPFSAAPTSRRRPHGAARDSSTCSPRSGARGRTSARR